MRAGNFLFGIILFTAVLFPVRVNSYENSSFLYRKGTELALAGRHEEASLVFKQVIEISPYYSLGYYGLGKIYLFKYGMLDQAVFHLARAVDLDKRFAKGYFYLGMAYLLNGKLLGALHAFDSSYRNDSNLTEALFNIGVIYDLMGKTYESGVYFKKYNKSMESDDDYLFN